MINNSKIISLILMVFCFASIAFTQETTGTIEITTKDNTGALVPGITVTVISVEGTTGFRRVVTTDDQGFQRILQVPPGTYRLSTAEFSGFAARRLDNVRVVLGKATPVSLELAVSGVGAVVDVTADSAPIDTTDTKIQTNITSEVAELLPKGVSFSSLLKISPATRPEPKSGGFQIDGASGSENTFIIDGHEVTNAISGTLDGNNDLPFQLVKEVQIKSSGFEAEYGGATGGVINVVTKGGNNNFSGEFGLNFEPGPLQAKPRDVLYLDGSNPIYLQYNNEESLGFYPSASLSGPIVKNRAWFFTSYTPQVFTRGRTINYRRGLAPQEYRGKTTYEYAFGRIDAQPIDSVRVTGTYTWNPIVVEGEVPGLTTQFDTRYPSGLGLEGPQYQDQLGGRQNSNITSIQAVWSPTNNFILSGRYGDNFLNSKLGTYGRPAAFPYTTGNTRVLCSASSFVNPPSAFGCTKGGSNGIGLYNATAFDATKRTTYDFDATYILSNFGGRHEFKGGYQRNEIVNEINQLLNGYFVLRFGQPIDNYAGRSVDVSPDAIGSGLFVRQGANGAASSTNEGVYFQDKWQPINRLTLNLGLRVERENVPSFNDSPGIVFDFSDKIAPRIGVAYDLTGDGKTKISGFYGRFFDRFKYELPRGSFGGFIYYTDYFEIFPSDAPFTSFTADKFLGSNPPTPIGGICPQTGIAFGRIRCSIDRRVPSNDPSLDVATQGGIDPDIKAYRQSELTFTFERELNSKFVLAARYTRKQLDYAIEDAGFITPSGSEAYIIGNPGFGLVKEFYEASGFEPRKAVRDYDAFEIRLDRRFADDYYFNLNYTYSRLYGNYSGLASSDEEGRTDPNVSRAFDAAFTEAVIVDGSNTLGRLATDRPHVLKFAGAYSLDWNRRFGVGSNNTTEFQTFFTVQSGTPLTTFADVAGYDNIILYGRGDLGRTETFTQTDFAIRHRYRFGRDNRFTMVGEVDVRNLFNENHVTDRYNLISQTVFDLTDPDNGLVTEAEADSADGYRLATQRFQANGSSIIAAGAADPARREPRYNLPENFQVPREIRFGFRFIF